LSVVRLHGSNLLFYKEAFSPLNHLDNIFRAEAFSNATTRKILEFKLNLVVQLEQLNDAIGISFNFVNAPIHPRPDRTLQVGTRDFVAWNTRHGFVNDWSHLVGQFLRIDLWTTRHHRIN